MPELDPNDTSTYTHIIKKLNESRARGAKKREGCTGNRPAPFYSRRGRLYYYTQDRVEEERDTTTNNQQRWSYSRGREILQLSFLRSQLN